jgi:drug/metabolite transporter (DMT)-like permease
VTVVMVMRVGDVAVVAPFRYTALLWALLFGWLFFGTLPDFWSGIGAVIVVLSGFVTLQLARGQAKGNTHAASDA